MNVLDLFDTVYERALQEGAVDDLEARYIHRLNTKMLDLMARAKNAEPEHKAALKQAYEKIKAERDSFYKIREGSVTRTATGLKHQASPDTYGGYKPEPELKGLNKTLTKNLEKGMGVEFKRAKKFGGGIEVDETGIPGNVPTEKIPGKEELLKGRGRTYYEAQKKNSETVDEHGGGIGPSQRWQDLMPEDDQDTDESIKKGAAGAALAACIAAGGTLSGCATNPSVGGAIGTARDLGTAAKTAGSMTRAGVQDELSQELRNFIRAQGGDPGSQNLSLLYKLQKRLQGKQDQPQTVNEIKDTEAVEQAILKRVMVAHRDMLMQYGPEKIMTAASDVAYDVGDVGEIGSSDISGWVKQVQQILGATP